MIRNTLLRHPRISATTAAAVAGVAALTLTGTASAAPTTDRHHGGPKPTVVLVHGAFVDASSWNKVIAQLQKDGYQVVAPANPLRGLDSDSDYLRGVLNTVKGPIVLAGHSYGGSVISQAAAGNPNVKALVYIAAIAPEVGESVGSIGAGFPATPLNSALLPLTYSTPGGGTGVDLYVDPAEFHDVVAPDLPRAVDAVAAAAQRAAAANIFSDPAAAAAWKTIPSWDLVTTQDNAINPDEQRFMAARAHAHTVEVASSHAVTLSHADAVTRLIEQAARSTDG